MREIRRVWLAVAMLLGTAGVGIAEDGEAVPTEQNAVGDYYRAMELWKELKERPEGRLLTDFPGEGQIGPELVQALRTAEAVLKEVDKGAGKERCRWDVDWSKGIRTELPHLGRMRELARLVVVRARWSFQEGRRRDGLWQAIAIVRMGRHIGQTEGVIIEHLVGVSTQKLGQKILMDHFSQLAEADLRFLEAEWAKLPKGSTAGSAMRAEAQRFAGWLLKILEEGGVEEELAEMKAPEDVTADDLLVQVLEKMADEPEAMRKQIAEVQTWMRELAEVMDGPWERFVEVDKRIGQNLKERKNQVAEMMMPECRALYRTEARSRVSEAMLTAAMAYRRGGLERLKEIRDPITNQPFELRRVDGKSFELIWRPPDWKEPFKQTFR